jgi:hypothetical protein
MWSKAANRLPDLTAQRQIDHAVAADFMTVQVASHSRRENAVALTEAGTALVRQDDALIDATAPRCSPRSALWNSRSQ